MQNIALGFVLGVVVATVGFGGIARMLDHGVNAVKTQSELYSR